MFILIYFTRQYVARAKRFMNMDSLLLFVNKLMNSNGATPYCVIHNHYVFADHQYFMEIYKKKAKKISQRVEAFISAQNIEREDWYVRHIK